MKKYKIAAIIMIITALHKCPKMERCLTEGFILIGFDSTVGRIVG